VGETDKQAYYYISRTDLLELNFKRRRRMKNLVIVSMPAKIEKVGQLKELLVEMLPDTRKFKGCISVNTFFEEATSTFHLVEDWES